MPSATIVNSRHCLQQEFNSIGEQGDKVGIVTLDGNFNYGNRLQLYAVYKIYKSLGFDPEYLSVSNLAPHTLVDSMARVVLNNKVDDPQSLSSRNRLMAFSRFNSMVKTRHFNRINDIPQNEYKWFSVGSDQVWNPGMVRNRSNMPIPIRPLLLHRDAKWAKHIINWYFLGFCERGKRVALAPSIGIDHLDDVQESLVKDGIAKFDTVSIREEAGANIIERLCGKRPPVICDPTLMVTPDDWRAVADDALTPTTPYIFTYLLGGIGCEAKEALSDIHCSSGVENVIHLSDRQKPDELDAGPSEFVSLIDNASHVVTDSFHAAVFASMLGTPLTIVHREGGAAMFSRLESLTKRLGIEHAVFGSSGYALSRAGDYQQVPDAIASMQEEFSEYLRIALRT